MNTIPLLTSASQQPRGWQVAWAQIKGLHHPLNEDYIAIRSAKIRGVPGTNLFAAVADGVGGGARGEVAAQALAEYTVALDPIHTNRTPAIVSWMEGAEAEVQAALRQVTQAPGAATLAAIWLCGEGTGHLLRVGDARLYLVTPCGVQVLTQDQTYALTGQPLPPGFSPQDCANMVGTGYMGSPEVERVAVDEGSYVLLASDGLHRGLDLDELHATLFATPEPDRLAQLEASARHLCTRARAAGSEDDISAVLLWREPRPPRSWWAHLV